VEDVGEGGDEQGLGQAGDADEQAVAAGEQRRQQEVDDLLLADDALADLGLDGVARGGQFVGGSNVVAGWLALRECRSTAISAMAGVAFLSLGSQARLC